MVTKVHVYVQCLSLSFQAREDLLKFDTTTGYIVIIEEFSVKAPSLSMETIQGQTFAIIKW